MILQKSTLDGQLTSFDSAPCAVNTDLFWHPLVEDAQPARSTSERREQQALIARATQTCAGCPLVQQCLYQAVVEHNVAGVAGGTTPRQRALIRSKLGIRVVEEHLDSFAAAPGSRQLDHEDVLRMRLSKPNESLESLAQRLGCSLSTVKRHLRKARSMPRAATPHLASVRPSLEQVLHATRLVLGGGAMKARTERAA